MGILALLLPILYLLRGSLSRVLPFSTYPKSSWWSSFSLRTDFGISWNTLLRENWFSWSFLPLAPSLQLHVSGMFGMPIPWSLILAIVPLFAWSNVSPLDFLQCPPHSLYFLLVVCFFFMLSLTSISTFFLLLLLLFFLFLI